MREPIYLDNSATTPMCEEALAVFIEVSRSHYGNPSSLHALGHDAERIIEGARERILSSLYAKDGDIIFTSSGTEANNLAIFGRAYAKERFRRKAKVITALGEHASVSAPFDALEKEGYRVAKIPTLGGVIDMEALRRELTREVCLVSFMLVNNETGAVYNIPEAARLVKELSPDAYIHVDATQGYMKIPFSPSGLLADAVTVSAHKIAGPKGVGALYISERVKKEKGLSAVTLGGGQEGGLRSGTENVAGIAAFAAAAERAFASLKPNIRKMEGLRNKLIDVLGCDARFSEISVTRPPMHAPHILNITLPDIKSETMLHFLSSEGIFVSSGSACSSNSRHHSSALVAYGRSEGEADTSIRISFSPSNTEEEIDTLVSVLAEGLKRLARIK